MDDLATAIQTTTCLQPGARFELMGEPVQSVAAEATLASIAQDHSFLDPASLAALNAATPNLLAPGQTIAIPGQSSRPITAGESFGSIALGAGIPVTLLGTANANTPILAEHAWSYDLAEIRFNARASTGVEPDAGGNRDLDGGGSHAGAARRETAGRQNAERIHAMEGLPWDD